MRAPLSPPSAVAHALALALAGAGALAGCGGTGNSPPRDATPADGATSESGVVGTDATPPGTDAGTDAGSDGGWAIPPGCGLSSVSLATLGFAPVFAPAAAIPAVATPATVSAVDPDRLTFSRNDTGVAYYFRTAGPSLAGELSVGEAIEVRATVDPVTQLTTHVVETAGATRAAVLYLFGNVLPAPNASATGTGLSLAFGASCFFADIRETCRRPPEDLERRAIDATGTAGTLALWSGDQGFRDGWIVTVVDALILPGYAAGACALSPSAYLGVTFLPSP